jgi:predicted MFS family arabinose efflux permease
LGVLLVVWGLSGTVANLLAGHFIDRLGARKVIAAMLIVLVFDIALTPWTGANIWTASISIAIWGGFGWGVLVPQQHRLVSLAPSIASVVVGLNTSGTYFGVTAAGLLGAAGIGILGAHSLGFLGAIFVLMALIFAELASRRIEAGNVAEPVQEAV